MPRAAHFHGLSASDRPVVLRGVACVDPFVGTRVVRAATYLVPSVPVRQWVLSLPFELRGISARGLIALVRVVVSPSDVPAAARSFAVVHGVLRAILGRIRTAGQLVIATALFTGCATHRTPSGPSALGIQSLIRVDADMAQLMAAAQVPGMALALIDDGRVVYERAYGMADRDRRLPLRTDTVMYAASLTKTAFAHLVMQLVDAGVVPLDAPVGELLEKPLPEYPDLADLRDDPRWRRLTPRMLLTHTSGLVNWRWINDDGKLDFKFDPGTRYAYSGEGIQILQLVVEERTGQSLADLMQRRVFDRFAMTRTSLAWRPDFEGNAATEYDAPGKPIAHRRRTRAQAAGSMDTTVHDYAAFMAAVLRGDGLSAASAAAMLSAQVAIVSPQEFPTHWPGETDVNRAVGLSYGLGWGVYISPLGPAFFKEGHDDGTDNFALGFRDSKRGVVFLSNSGNAERLFFPAVERLFGKTCLPWFWMGYVPYSRPDLLMPKARKHPVPPCGSP
jgi:CubicO group peptidase (beta-lactamase class C family)